MIPRNEKQKLVAIHGLKKYYTSTRYLFNRKKDVIRAVDGVSFDIISGETFGLVGESGSGKSTIGRNILQLERPTAGTVTFEDIELTKLNEDDLNKVRKRMQIVFQDPYSSLNPRMPVGKFIEEPLIVHKMMSTRKERMGYVREIMNKVGLDPKFIDRYPHEFSGGQRQRVGIARAIVLNPAFIIADEPITALDVSIQAQIINLFQDLREELNLTYLFIAHDLSMIRYFCHRVAVIYRGKIVEMAETDELYKNPIHPYTKALLSSVPIPDPKIEKQRKSIQFDPSRIIAQTETSLQEVGPRHYVAPYKNRLRYSQ